MTELDIPALLRALAEQQTALLAAHAESMRVQRVLIERLTNTGAVAHPPDCGPTETGSAPGATTENQVGTDAVAPAGAAAVADRVEDQSANTIATSVEPEAVVADRRLSRKS